MLGEDYYGDCICYTKHLHKGTLRKIYIDTLQHKNSGVSNGAVDLLNGNLEVINYELKHITKDELTDHKVV